MASAEIRLLYKKLSELDARIYRLESRLGMIEDEHDDATICDLMTATGNQHGDAFKRVKYSDTD